MNEEIWKDIINYEGLYQVSNFGRVKVVKTGNIRKPFSTTKFYLRVDLWNKGRKLNFYIHRLVAYAFIGINPEGKLEVNHKDFNKLNNHVDNLEWMTGEENIKHYRDTL